MSHHFPFFGRGHHGRYRCFEDLFHKMDFGCSYPNYPNYPNGIKRIKRITCIQNENIIGSLQIIDIYQNRLNQKIPTDELS